MDFELRLRAKAAAFAREPVEQQDSASTPAIEVACDAKRVPAATAAPLPCSTLRPWGE
jgi:hypothetical protein